MDLDEPDECQSSVAVCPTNAITIDDAGKVLIRTDLCDGVHCQKCVRECSTGELTWDRLKVVDK
ncbi:hypothetical protein D5R95_04760 [Methanosalsum natronophilum]|uniref:4Fe-4S ferredoxin-type domain-containing protein n=2 Tax=Methanosalsum natronophilum TaxID=768733 RepID=A0A424YY35_9EURY|nr:MAG: hypothetical protein D5R95_04760 [Methanosalsum natronophilum]